MRIDPALTHAWLVARSIARGLPAPVAEHGGFRVDTRSEAEVCRWVFTRVAPGLRALGRTIDAPRHFVKLCGTNAELRAALPAHWALAPLSHFMISGDARGTRPLASGYAIERQRKGRVIEARIRSADGAVAASGYAAETADAFVYDRIVTAAEHRRRGLGAALMTALRDSRRDDRIPELLVATKAGRALYETLGWRVISPYATASIPAA